MWRIFWVVTFLRMDLDFCFGMKFIHYDENKNKEVIWIRILNFLFEGFDLIFCVYCYTVLWNQMSTFPEIIIMFIIKSSTINYPYYSFILYNHNKLC